MAAFPSRETAIERAEGRAKAAMLMDAIVARLGPDPGRSAIHAALDELTVTLMVAIFAFGLDEADRRADFVHSFLQTVERRVGVLLHYVPEFPPAAA